MNLFIAMTSQIIFFRSQGTHALHKAIAASATPLATSEVTQRNSKLTYNQHTCSITTIVKAILLSYM